MIQATKDKQLADREFAAFTDKVTSVIDAGNAAEVERTVAEFIATEPPAGQQRLAQALLCSARGEYGQAVSLFGESRELLEPDEYPVVDSIYTLAFVNAQLFLPPRTRPAGAIGHRFYKSNIAALREVDAELADEIQSSAWDDRLVLLELWGGLSFAPTGETSLLLLSDAIREQLEKQVKSRNAIGFGGIGTGQELRYCLDHQVNILHGMARPHYLFEPDLCRLRAMMHLFDFSSFLHDRELIIFGGTTMSERIKDIFGGFRYNEPAMLIGDLDVIRQHYEPIIADIHASVPEDDVRRYYSGEEFRKRQRAIVDGEIMPRVLVCTCRWTTFLQYCAADFEKAFAMLGCETYYLIEENNAQTTLPALQWKIMHEFRPDVVFMVSHARPTRSFTPPELPVIGYIQDKCGPVARLSDLAEHISDQDLFVCMMEHFRDYLVEKSVPKQQCFIMPIPADETMFVPLPADHPDALRFDVDVAFVKHGHAHVEEMMRAFEHSHIDHIEHKHLRNCIRQAFTYLYENTCLSDDRCHYEGQMLRYITDRLTGPVDEKLRHGLSQLVSEFYITVYSSFWRCRFLEALDAAGVELALYGNGWDKHDRLAHLGRGPVARDSELNLVYNFSRINLSINQGTTMHQRLSECGLAGGFMMVADHDENDDWGPARPYFAADTEAIYFGTPKDLVEKCRFYLSHEDERNEIASNMHQRAVKERTCRAGAEAVLARWRELLGRTLS